MKPAGTFYVRWIAVTTFGSLLAAVLGWLGSRGSDRDDAVASTRPTRPQPGLRDVLEEGRSQRSGDVRSDEIRKRLVGMYENHPEPGYDWRLRSEAHLLLSELSAEELGDWYVNGIFFGSRADDLRASILRAWALKDGPAAVMGGWRRSSETGHFSAQSAFSSWSEHEREKAYEWLENGNTELPPGIRQWFLQNSLDHYGRSDFQAAASYLRQLDSARQQGILIDWAEEGQTNAALRKGMEEYLEANPEARMSMLRGQIGRMKEDPEVFGFIARLDLPAEDRFSLDLSATVAKAVSDPVGAFRGWMERHADQQEVPAGILGSFHTALVFRQDEVLKWLDEIPSGRLRDDFHARSIPVLAGRGAFGDAATYAESIGDPVKRADAIRALGDIWIQKQSEAAKTWLQTHEGNQ